MNTACIFDLDGVIVDTAKYHFLAWQRLAHSLGARFTEHDNEQLKGVSRIDSLKLILRLNQLTLTQTEFDDALAQKNNWYLDDIHKIGPEEILPGVLPLLDSVKAAGMKIALGSASKNAGLILDRIQLRDAFNAIVDGNRVTQTKPDPEVFLVAARDLGAPPADCIVFEDAAAGVQAALRAGMRVVGIGTAEHLREAHYVIPNFEGMTIERLMKQLP